MSTVKFEKGFKIPAFRGKKKKGISDKYKLHQLEIYSEENESSIFIESQNHHRVRAAISDFARNNNMEFTVQAVSNGVRVWRIK